MTEDKKIKSIDSNTIALSKEQIEYLGLFQAGIDPVNVKEGDIYHNVTSREVRLYKDNMWANITNHNFAELVARKVIRLQAEASKE